MGYRGQTIEIPVGQSGLNYNPNISLIPKNSLLWPSRNLDMHNGVLETRGGTSRVNSTAISGSPQVMGLTDFRLNDGTQYQVFATSDGKLWKNSTTTIQTGMSLSNRYSFETFDVADTNSLFIADGSTVPQVWDGTSASTNAIASKPTDWISGNFPQQLVRHQQGFAMVMFAIGFATTKKNVYGSADDDANDFSDANVRLFTIDTGDGYGPVGGVDFGQRLFVFGKEQAFYLNDVSANSDEWYFVPAQFKGGVAHWRLLVKTDNDLLAMMQDGTIYSVTSALEFGDYKLANLARPAFIDRWIRENINLAQIEQFHAIYDPTRRCVMWFMVRTGQTQVKCALKFYVDRPPQDAWMVDEQPDYASGYNASCSARVQTSTGTYRIYTGDYSGTIWKLGESNTTDDGNPYYSGFRLPDNYFEATSVPKAFARIWIMAQPKGNYALPFRWWLDGIQKTSGEFSLETSGAKFNFSQFDNAKFGASIYIDAETEIGDVGRRIGLEVYNSIAERRFSVSAVRFDLKPLGAAVQP